MNDVGLHTPLLEPARQPEPTVPGSVDHHHAFDLPAPAARRLSLSIAVSSAGALAAIFCFALVCGKPGTWAPITHEDLLVSTTITSVVS
jgi:hypothetical protein